MKNLKSQLEQRKADFLYRTRRICESAQQPEMIIDGRKVISFCSNDYLGMANHAAVKQAFIRGIEQYGAGSGSAHLVNGHNEAHHRLEQRLAEITGYPRALLFSTGYMANLGVAQALLTKKDTVLEDKLNHASLIDGGLLSGARFMRYAHNDIDALNDKLSTRQQGDKLVISDGVFSMDGDIADVPQLVKSCESHEASLMIDDAHGFGTLGEDGSGINNFYQLPKDKRPQIYMATLGKAIGTAGAFVAASEDIIETLIQQARTYIYTTAQPPAIAIATLESLRLLEDEPQHREKLQSNIAHFKQFALQTGLEISNSMTAIQPIIIGDVEKTVTLSDHLFVQGFLVTAIRPPTVPSGTSRLRITLSASHDRKHIEQLINCIISNIH